MNSHQTFGEHNLEPLDLLVIAPHPDDAEIGAGGTLARAASEGKRSGILELTRGEMGSLGTPELRDTEAMDAAKILGLAYRGNLRWADGHVQDVPQHRLELAQVLRTLRPSTLIVPCERDRHPDHIGAAQVCASAVHFAGLRRAPLEGEPHRVSRFLSYQGNAPIEPNVLVNVTDHMNIWAEAILAHNSQFTGEAVSETVTPEILERREARMMYWGTFIGVRYAEAFETRGPIEIQI
jgi:N-acetylglucosamine malate deacetylase 1